MVSLQEAIIEMEFKRLIKNKIELSLFKMEMDLRKELEDNHSSPIEIKFGKDEEACKYIIKINNEQIKFTMEDVTKALMEFSNDNTKINAGQKSYKKVKIV